MTKNIVTRSRYGSLCSMVAALVIAFIAMLYTSCKKFVTVEPPIDKITSTTVFSNNQTATSAVLGVYSNMMMTDANFFNGAITINTGLSGDELVYNSTVDEVKSFYTNSLSASNSMIGDLMWSRAYSILYQTNACIEGLEQSAGVTDSVRKQLTGEMKLVRGFIHFYLANVFGDVPLVLTTNYAENSVMPRTAKQAVLQQVVKDAEAAKVLLSDKYPSAGRVRPVKAAASALLARVYLYMQEWSKAEAAATAVINNSMYGLVANTDNVFVADNGEAIWQLMPVVAGFNTIEGNRFVPGTATARPQYSLSTALLNAFEAGDKRKTSWTKVNVSAGIPYTFPNKYKVRSSTTVTEHYTLLRLAEQYLIRAEARVEQNDIAGAKTDIDVIRMRAGLAATTAITKAAVLTAIEKERRIELFAEWGHRWFDLKRWNSADAVLGVAKPGWKSYMQLYPIPHSQLLTNPFLTQNPGY